MGEFVAWVPRVAFAPLMLAVQALRLPVRAVLVSHPVQRALAAGAARDRPPRIGPRISVTPVIVLDRGMRPELGAELDVAGIFTTVNRVSLALSTGGERFYSALLADRVAFARGADAGVRAYWRERPENVFAGIGVDAAHEERFWMRRAGVAATLSLTLAREPVVGVTLAAGPRWTEVELPASVAAQGPLLDRYGALATDGEVYLDTRGPNLPRSGGLRVAIGVRHGLDLRTPIARRWASGMLRAGAYAEVLRERAIGLEMLVVSAQPLGDEPVPFAELPVLDEGMMRGFLPGRLRGESAAAAGIVYRWPVWFSIEVEMRFDVGGTFGSGFAGLHAGALRGSWSMAVRTDPRLPLRVECLLGVGTSRFDDAARFVEHVRTLLAFTRRF